MKTLRVPASLLLIIVICCGLFAGCGKEETTPIALAIIYGNHANQNRYEHSDSAKVTALKSVNDLLKNSDFVYDGSVAVIAADGQPRDLTILNTKGNPAKFQQDANSPKIKRERITAYTDLVWKFLDSDATKAQYPEVDLFKALTAAQQALAESSDLEKYLVILDPGVSTKGDISWKIMESIDNPKATESFIEQLKSIPDYLPDLSDVQVYWYGLNDVAEPQTLSRNAENQLISFWEAILTACGAKNPIVKGNTRGETPNVYTEEDDGYPTVRPVTFGTVTFGIDGKIDLPKVIFKPDLDVLKDDEESVKSQMTKQVQAIIEYLANKPTEKLYLVGTTATKTRGGDGDVDLSQRRANKLRQLLISMGVPADRIVAVGVGARVPKDLRVEENSNGNFNTILAEANRKAAVYTRDSEELQKIQAFKDNAKFFSTMD